MIEFDSQESACPARGPDGICSLATQTMFWEDCANRPPSILFWLAAQGRGQSTEPFPVLGSAAGSLWASIDRTLFLCRLFGNAVAKQAPPDHVTVLEAWAQNGYTLSQITSFPKHVAARMQNAVR